LINYQTFAYFWMVAKARQHYKSPVPFCTLHRKPSVDQISLLEEQLGKDLFNKVGRNLVLSRYSHMVLEL